VIGRIEVARWGTPSFQRVRAGWDGEA
jgi:hypothetical protein